jgi:hypothetical protein
MERCHYLSRRAELERNAVYVADELDLLALYTENQFNIGDSEFDGTRHVWYGLSAEITPLLSLESKRGVPLPHKRTAFWSTLLAALDKKRPPGWTDMGHRLLNVSFSGQREIEKLLGGGLKKIARRPTMFFTTGLTQGPRSRMETISINVGARVLPEQFKENLAYAAKTASEQGGQDTILVLYWYSPRTSDAYDFIGMLNRA